METKDVTVVAQGTEKTYVQGAAISFKGVDPQKRLSLEVPSFEDKAVRVEGGGINKSGGAYVILDIEDQPNVFYAGVGNLLGDQIANGSAILEEGEDGEYTFIAKRMNYSAEKGWEATA